MNYFLAKTEPGTYSIEDLQKDGRTTWDGIKNPQALRAVKLMKPGDLVYIYHSQGQAALVGLAKVVADPRPDARIEKSWVVDLEFVGKFKEAVTLREIKETGLFDDWSLVRQGRLSTMAVPEKFVSWMKEKGYGDS